MLNWNVMVKVHEHSFSKAYLLLEELGKVYQSDFENVLLLEVDSVPSFLENLNDKLSNEPSLLKNFSRIVPVTSAFSFQSVTEFETKAKEVVSDWLSKLAGKSFYVDMHRLGLKGQISSDYEEDFLDRTLLEELEKMGSPGQIDFEDPDALVAVETVSHQAGLACWTREDLQRYPWLKLG
ncbi:hypothetical protein IQ255_01555 [Pleurocapsales cyanobacterium LEGE 10410]|nr:hypothetical protein [Pleurocapsales cyanobacterium LEGE 10410]